MRHVWVKRKWCTEKSLVNRFNRNNNPVSKKTVKIWNKGEWIITVQTFSNHMACLRKYNMTFSRVKVMRLRFLRHMVSCIESYTSNIQKILVRKYSRVNTTDIIIGSLVNLIQFSCAVTYWGPAYRGPAYRGPPAYRGHTGCWATRSWVSCQPVIMVCGIWKHITVITKCEKWYTPRNPIPTLQLLTPANYSHGSLYRVIFPYLSFSYCYWESQPELMLAHRATDSDRGR